MGRRSDLINARFANRLSTCGTRSICKSAQPTPSTLRLTHPRAPRGSRGATRGCAEPLMRERTPSAIAPATRSRGVCRLVAECVLQVRSCVLPISCRWDRSCVRQMHARQDLRSVCKRKHNQARLCACLSINRFYSKPARCCCAALSISVLSSKQARSQRNAVVSCLPAARHKRDADAELLAQLTRLKWPHGCIQRMARGTGW